MNTRFNRILFDYDGTLIIHDKENEARNVAKLLGLRDVDIPEFEKRLNLYFEKHFSIKGKKITYEVYFKNLERIIKIYEDFGISAEQLHDAICENSKKTTTLIPHAKEVLEYLSSKGYQLCVFTNGFYNNQAENMQYKGIFDYFEKIYAWDDFYAKPDERAFFRAISNSEPTSNIMIGDTISADIIPAKNLGLYTIGINVDGQDMTQGSPDIIISNFLELKEIL